MNGNKDIKPMSWARKSEIAERADTLEARAEAKKEAEAQAEPFTTRTATNAMQSISGAGSLTQ